MKPALKEKRCFFSSFFSVYGPSSIGFPLVQHTHPSRCYSDFFFFLSLCPFGLGGVPGTKSPQGRTKAITIDRFLCCAE